MIKMLIELNSIPSINKESEKKLADTFNLQL